MSSKYQRHVCSIFNHRLPGCVVVTDRCAVNKSRTVPLVLKTSRLSTHVNMHSLKNVHLPSPYSTTRKTVLCFAALPACARRRRRRTRPYTQRSGSCRRESRCSRPLPSDEKRRSRSERRPRPWRGQWRSSEYRLSAIDSVAFLPTGR